MGPDSVSRAAGRLPTVNSDGRRPAWPRALDRITVCWPTWWNWIGTAPRSLGTRCSRPCRCAANCTSSRCGQIEISTARAFMPTCSRSSSKRSTAPASSAGGVAICCWPGGSVSRRQAGKRAAPDSRSAGGSAWCSTQTNRPCLGACGKPFDGIAGDNRDGEALRAVVRRMLSAGLRSSIRSGGSKPYRAGSYRPHALSTGQGTAKCSSGGIGALPRPMNTGFRGRQHAEARPPFGR